MDRFLEMELKFKKEEKKREILLRKCRSQKYGDSGDFYDREELSIKLKGNKGKT